MTEEQFSILLARALSNEITPDEMVDFQGFIAINPDHASLFMNLEELWKSSPDHSGSLPATEEAFLLHLGRLKDQVNDFEEDLSLLPAVNEDFQLYPVKRHKFFKWQSLAAALVIILMVALFSRISTNNKQRNTLAASGSKHLNEINVNPGVKTKLQLPDGSQVWVNSDSKLSYAETFSGSTREVNLVGEAYFDVVKDPKHPFIVHTSGIDIKVLGTAFNVKAYTADPTIEATLIRGMIEVTKINQPNAPKVILKPHEKMVFNKYAVEEGSRKDPRLTDNNTHLEEMAKPAITITPLNKNIADSAIIETSWVYNRLSFDEEKFDDLAVKMERWFNVKITINTEKIKSYRLTGSFENETIEEALKELQYLVLFNYRISGSEVIINKK